MDANNTADAGTSTEVLPIYICCSVNCQFCDVNADAGNLQHISYILHVAGRPVRRGRGRPPIRFPARGRPPVTSGRSRGRPRRVETSSRSSVTTTSTSTADLPPVQNLTPENVPPAQEQRQQPSPSFMLPEMSSSPVSSSSLRVVSPTADLPLIDVPSHENVPAAQQQQQEPSASFRMPQLGSSPVRSSPLRALSPTPPREISSSPAAEEEADDEQQPTTPPATGPTDPTPCTSSTLEYSVSQPLPPRGAKRVSVIEKTGNPERTNLVGLPYRLLNKQPEMIELDDDDDDDDPIDNIVFDFTEDELYEILPSVPNFDADLFQ